MERERPALARRLSGAGGLRHGAGTLLGNGIPLAAGVALALPAAGDGAAVLADEGERAAGHRCDRQRNRRRLPRRRKPNLVGWVERQRNPSRTAGVPPALVKGARDARGPKIDATARRLNEVYRISLRCLRQA